MDFLELVTGARTCRRFREAEGMPAGMLDWLIACARVTPCGGNAQALRNPRKLAPPFSRR